MCLTRMGPIIDDRVIDKYGDSPIILAKICAKDI